jgi:hypothetical protein
MCGWRVPLSLAELPACSTCSRGSGKSGSRSGHVRRRCQNHAHFSRRSLSEGLPRRAMQLYQLRLSLCSESDSRDAARMDTRASRGTDQTLHAGSDQLMLLRGRKNPGGACIGCPTDCEALAPCSSDVTMTGRVSASATVSYCREQDIPRLNVRSLTGTSSRVRLWQGGSSA